MICHGCGGIVGRDCFNPQECEQITRDMANDSQNLSYEIQVRDNHIKLLEANNEEMLKALINCQQLLKSPRGIRIKEIEILIKEALEKKIKTDKGSTNDEYST